MAKKNYYDEDFKRTLVKLYHNGKTQASLIKEYGEMCIRDSYSPRQLPTKYHRPLRS